MAIAYDALLMALKHKLEGQSLWQDRVYPDSAPAGVIRPYVVHFYVSGGERNERQKKDARFVITVKCVAETMGESMQGAALLESLLNDAGSQDDQAFTCGDGWEITTCTQDRLIHIKEMFAGAAEIYHDGHQYIVMMEAT